VPDPPDVDMAQSSNEQDEGEEQRQCTPGPQPSSVRPLIPPPTSEELDLIGRYRAYPKTRCSDVPQKLEFQIAFRKIFEPVRKAVEAFCAGNCLKQLTTRKLTQTTLELASELLPTAGRVQLGLALRTVPGDPVLQPALVLCAFVAAAITVSMDSTTLVSIIEEEHLLMSNRNECWNDLSNTVPLDEVHKYTVHWKCSSSVSSSPRNSSSY
jgi:hypothetical protein